MSDRNFPEQSEHAKLPKSMGVFKLTVYGVGTIIGSGIYAVIGPAAANAGSGIWISFLIAAVISAFTALSYAELGSALPNAGAEHNFLKQAFPKLPAAAFLVGLFIAIHGAATVATVALTFGNYLQKFIELPVVPVALGLIAIFTLTNILGLKRASWINVAFTILQVSCLVVLIYAGFTNPDFNDKFSKVLSSPVNWDGVFGATAIVFFIYTGYEHMASLSEEAIDPGRDLWKAFLLALVITTLVYAGVIISILGIVDVSEIAASNGPLSMAGESRWKILGTAITGAALLATANGVLSGSVSISRLLFGVARAGEFPKKLASTTENSKSPWFAALMVMIVACAFVFVGEIELVASLSSLGALLVFAMINAAVISLRVLKPQLKRPFRIPLSIGRIPILPSLGVLFSLLLATRYKGSVYGCFLIGVAAGVGLYFWRKNESSKS